MIKYRAQPPQHTKTADMIRHTQPDKRLLVSTPITGRRWNFKLTTCKSTSTLRLSFLLAVITFRLTPCYFSDHMMIIVGYT
ncbi:hypothetical protein K3495_g5630 [Podosphaera aphanis]|nr:hypothetical protein K3495_g5630 [Podosphaera aphanis]